MAYCRNCGTRLNDNAAVCLNCGVATGGGDGYCPNCGSDVGPGSDICLNCGVMLNRHNNQSANQMSVRGVTKYCRNCGSEVLPDAVICMSCGCALKNVVSAYSQQREQKSKFAAGLLAILAGFLGVHNFYLGYTGRGIAQILLSLFSCGFLFWVSWIWAIVEGILIFSGWIGTDAYGNDLI